MAWASCGTPCRAVMHKWAHLQFKLIWCFNISQPWPVHEYYKGKKMCLNCYPSSLFFSLSLKRMLCWYILICACFGLSKTCKIEKEQNACIYHKMALPDWRIHIPWQNKFSAELRHTYKEGDKRALWNLLEMMQRIFFYHCCMPAF